MQNHAVQITTRWLGRAGLLLALLAAGFPAGAQAQGLDGYGVRGGLSLASVRGGAFVGVQAGATASVYGRFALGKGFSFQPELTYVRKGVNGEEDMIEEEEGDLVVGTFPPIGEVSLVLDNVEADVKATIDFVEVPLLVRYAPPVGGRFRPSFYAGPYAGFGFNRTAEVAIRGEFALRNAALEAAVPEDLLTQRIDEFQTVDELLGQINAFIPIINAQVPGANLQPIENPVDAGDLLDNVDYGLTVGADLGFDAGALGGRRAVLSVRYDLGLRELTQQDSDAVQAIQALISSIDDFRDTDGFEGRSSTLTVTLGVAF